MVSLPTWERGLKLGILGLGGLTLRVAPHVGAWIETPSERRRVPATDVAPHVGAWIETPQYLSNRQWHTVAPHVGAWIETFGTARA